MDEGVRFRFEIPNQAIARGDEALIDILSEPGAFYEIYEIYQEPGCFERDTTIIEGRCDRQVLAELGPIVEALHRAPDA